MADTEQQVAMLGDTPVSHSQCLGEQGEIITVSQTNDVDNGDVGEDILQQALDEATEGYDNTDVEYTTEENIAVVADSNGTIADANGATYSYVTAIPAESQTIPTVQTVHPGQSLIRISPNTHVAGVNQVVTLPRNSIVTNQHPQQQEPQVVQVIKQANAVQQVVQAQPQQATQTNIIEGISPAGLPAIQQTHVQLSQTDSGTPGSITVLTTSGGNGEPLGSSANPIRIIQQGNKYTSVQQLTPEQVAQIMQVVQQQQLAQSTTQGGGSSVLFNPQTQTRIVYRVIYPSELHSKTTGASGTITTTGLTKSAQPKTITVPQQMLTLGTSRRPYRKRLKDDEDKVDGPELTREEKELRKKHRPRTRSGRVSRPPKHMVQDYKHIHHLDWEEDQDDSDGGYSDYKVTDDEDGEKDTSRESALLDTNINSSKPKKFSCDKCEKAYIGAAGLARHYRLNPDHGNPEDVLPSLSKMKSSTNGIDMTINLADDSSTQDSISSTASLPAPATSLPLTSTPIVSSTLPNTIKTSDSTETEGPVPDQATETPAPAVTTMASQVKGTVPRGAMRAKQHYLQENTPTRRKSRLKELVRQCSDEELMEIVLPRLSRVITTWEFLLMKVERGRPSRPHIGDVLSEYEGLHKQVEKMCGDYLHPLPDNPDGIERHTNTLQVTNPLIAQSLGLTTGKYSVREVPRRDDSTFQYKLLTSEAGSMNTHKIQVNSGKRTVQLVTPDQLVAENPSKRVRLSEPCITSVTQSSDVVTVSMANGVFDEEATCGPVEVAHSGEEVSYQQEQEQPQQQQQQQQQHETKDSELTNCSETIQTNGGDVRLIGQDSGLVGTAEPVETVLLTVNDEEINGVPVHQHDVLESDIKAEDEVTERIISIATEHQTASGSDIVVCDSAVSPINEDGISASETTISVSTPGMAANVPGSEQVSGVSEEVTDTSIAPEKMTAGGQMEEVIEVQYVSEDAPQQVVMEVDEGDKSQLPSEVLCIDQMNEINGSGEDQAQVVAADNQTQQVLGEDGQTVLFSNDGGQTFYHQAPEVDQTQSQQITMEAGPQLVSMETPEGLVQGQLVTNEDGTQFLIPHQQESTEQTVYQTPEGLIVIHNPDGTLRILSNGDPQIPLETVQALLAIDNDGQVQAESSMEPT